MMVLGFFNESDVEGQTFATAITIDGIVVTSFPCHSEEYARRSLGMTKDSPYKIHMVRALGLRKGEKVTLEFVPKDKIDTHPALQLAIRNNNLPQGGEENLLH